MALNKSTGNMYDFVNKKPNPLAGKCSQNCGYCYVTKMKARYPALAEKYSGEPRVVPSVLLKKYKESDFVFVCDCNDLFASDVPDEVINEILSAYIDTPAQLFFQTKNPLRLCEFIDTIPKGSIICTTIETNRFYSEKMGFTSLPQTRAFAMQKIDEAGFEIQVTIEPIMDFDLPDFVDLIKSTRCSKVNIGADSSRNNLPEPSKEKLLALIDELQKFTTISRKTNLTRLLK